MFLMLSSFLQNSLVSVQTDYDFDNIVEFESLAKRYCGYLVKLSAWTVSAFPAGLTSE